MNENQLFETAQSMFLNDSGRKEVIGFLTQNGIHEEKAETMATDAYRAIKDQRKALIQEEEIETKKGLSNGVIIGVLLLLGGIVATMATDRIWYGAMIVGVISIISSAARSSS